MLKSQQMLIFCSTTTNLAPNIHHHHRHRQFLRFTQAPIVLRRSPARWLRLSAAVETSGEGPPTPQEEGPVELPPMPQQEGPVELLPTPLPVFATDDNPTFIQTATSVLLTGAISIFLFRSLRRRARRAKELQFRSTGVKKTVKEEALESLKEISLSPVVDEKTVKPPSPIQTMLGAITAGVIALILYKFTITIEASLNRQTISNNYSVRQITITIRTIINGLCYLATCVFAFNGLGLFLYTGQLVIEGIMEGPTSKKAPNEVEESSKTESPTNNVSENGKDSQNTDNP